MYADTLVIVFSPNNNPQLLKSGRRLFDALRDANSSCFWNTAFLSAVAGMNYAGFVRPSTLFITASPTHLDAIKAAYAKRMLKAPTGTTITSLGEMSGIRPVPQLHFVPLSDAFCDAVSHLNQCGRPANLQSIKEHIMQQCPSVAAPSDEMLLQTSLALAREGLIHSAGQHLFVAPAPAKTTVECQTGPSVNASPAAPSKGLLARIFFRGNKSGKSQLNSQTSAALQEVQPDWVYSERLATTPLDMHSEEPEIVYSHAATRGSRRGGIGHRKTTRRVGRGDHVAAGGQRSKRTPLQACNKLRASTPVDVDSAYSRSSHSHSDESDENRDHTYANLAVDETRFEECTLTTEKLLVRAI